MGYTHYWTIPDKCTRKQWRAAIKDVKDIVKRHGNILAYECDEPERKPMIDEKVGVRFNGIGDDGHETFALGPSGYGGWFCKTSMKLYDQAVCECLLVLRAHIAGFRLRSDGFSGRLADGVKLRGAWPAAMEAVKKYGIHYEGFISVEREPYCDFGMKLAIDGVDGAKFFDHDGYEINDPALTK